MTHSTSRCKSSGVALYTSFLLCLMFSGQSIGSTPSPTAEPSTKPSGLSDPTATNMSGDFEPSANAQLLSQHTGGGSDLTSLSLEQLMNVEVTTNTLTWTERQLVPAAVTTIDRPEIDNSGARSLSELLDIYVPDFEFDTAEFEEDHYGMRGIIGDRDDKYLLLVDGRVMNQRSHFGVLTERDLFLNGDINQIDVVRGPASATYGAGAVIGVISQTTYNGLTFQGTSVTARVGAIDNFGALEIKHGEKLGADTGWFVYGGVAQVTGAAPTYAPIVEGQNWTSATYGQVIAGKALPNTALYSWQDAEVAHSPQIKIHAQYDGDGVTLWTRYTRGGESLNSTDRGPFAPFPTGWDDEQPPQSTVSYEQLTGLAEIKRNLTPQLSLDAYTSLDVTDYQRQLWTTTTYNDSNQERKEISKVLFNWQMTPTNQLAAGSEFGYYWMGYPTWMTPSAGGVDSTFTHPMTWQSNMLSFLAEDQWHISKQWTLFLSARADKDRYTEWLMSPRGALAWQPTDRDTLKFIASESLRTNNEEDMVEQFNTKGSLSNPEKMKSLELRYERQQGDNLFIGTSVFYQKLDPLDWDSNTSTEANLGVYKTAGAELEVTYKTQNDTITASHSFTKLVGQSLNSGEGTNITAALYGDGYDLSNWSDNLTKLTWHHRFNDRLSTDASIRMEWGFNGDEEVQNYLNTVPFFGPGTPASTIAGYTQPYGPSAYLNLGAEYKLDEHSTVRFDAYNVLGWVNQTLNKRSVYSGIWAGNYRVEAPALGFTYKYNF